MSEMVALAISLALVHVEQSKLQGEWVLTSDEKRTGFSLTVQGSKFIFGYSDENRPRPPEPFKIVHPLIAPKGIDLLTPDGVVKCIYEIERDRLRLGIPIITLTPIPEHDRPTQWESDRADAPAVMNLKRKRR